MHSTTRIDPISFEVFRSGLNAAAEEMKLNLIRTAHSPLIHEILDFAVGLFDASGRTLAQAAGLPLFLGNLGAAIEDALETYGRDGFVPGDVVITNDPYTTGTHLGDASSSAPLFVEDELLGFAATRAHLSDIGGKAPGGGWFFDTTDVYQEGIRIKSLKIYEGGSRNRDIFSFIRYNSRFPESVIGDIEAQIAACRTGDVRFRALVGRLGPAAARAYFEAFMDSNEEIARAAVSRIPDGEYHADAFLDNDGIDLDTPIPLEVSVGVNGDEMTVDLSRVPPMSEGPINCGPTAAVSAARAAFVSLVGPFSTVNEGSFRPLNVSVVPGTILSATEPAPVAAYALPLVVIIDLIYRALAPALPDRVAAGHFGAISSIVVHGRRKASNERFIHIEGMQGGWGGRAAEDGESVLISLLNGDTRNVPVEVLETRAPLLVEEYALRTDSGGPGKFRGGLGFRRVHRILQDNVAVNIFFERSQCPPWGLFGGEPGLPNSHEVIHAGQGNATTLLKAIAFPLANGDRLRLDTGGGGGYGSPLDRDPDLVRLDVLRGYVSPERAYEDYGLVIDPVTLEIDSQGPTPTESVSPVRVDVTAIEGAP